MLAAAPGGIEVHDPRRVGAAPDAVVAGQRPQPAGFRPAAARIEHRRPRLVHEQLRRAFEMFRQPVGHRPQVERRLADPTGQGRDRSARRSVLGDRGGVLGVSGNECMGDCALGRQAALDQTGRRRRLSDAFLAPAAGVFRAHRDDHPQPRRHDV